MSKKKVKDMRINRNDSVGWGREFDVEKKKGKKQVECFKRLINALEDAKMELRRRKQRKKKGRR